MGVTGGSPRGAGAEAVVYMGVATGTAPSETGAGSVGYMGGDWRECMGAGCH